MEFSPNNTIPHQAETALAPDTLELAPARFSIGEGVMRGRATFNRLVRATALTLATLASAPAHADSLGRNVETGLKGVFAGSVVAGINKSFGGPVITVGMNKDGDIKTGVSQQGIAIAIQNAERAKVLKEQQEAQRRHIEAVSQVMNAPTQFRFDTKLEAALQGVGVRIEKSGDAIHLFGKSQEAFLKRLSFYNTDSTKLKSVDFTPSLDPNRFYAVKTSFNPQTGQDNIRHAFIVMYDPNTETWKCDPTR